MLLEAALVVEDLVADVDVLHPGAEEEPEEEAVDPAHQAGHKGAAGGEQEVRTQWGSAQGLWSPSPNHGCPLKGLHPLYSPWVSHPQKVPIYLFIIFFPLQMRRLLQLCAHEGSAAPAISPSPNVFLHGRQWAASSSQGWGVLGRILPPATTSPSAEMQKTER